MTDICPEVPCKIVPISDSFGPSIVDPTMDMLVVSRETLRGGQKVNEGKHVTCKCHMKSKYVNLYFQCVNQETYQNFMYIL